MAAYERDTSRDRSHRSGGDDPLARMAAHSSAVGDALRTLFAIRKDRAQLAMRRRIQTAAIASLAALAAGAAIVHAVVLAIRGIANGLQRLFGGREWLADLVTGVLVLAALAVGLAWAIRRHDRAELEKQRRKYDRSRNESESTPSAVG